MWRNINFSARNLKFIGNVLILFKYDFHIISIAQIHIGDMVAYFYMKSFGQAAR